MRGVRRGRRETGPAGGVVAVVAAPGTSVSLAQLRSHAAEVLPSTAARELHLVEELRRRGIGKLDRRALAKRFALREPPGSSGSARTMERMSRSDLVDELRDIVGHPNAAVANKVRDHLSGRAAVVVAFTAGLCGDCAADGRVDVSPKGDPPGFVQIIDERTIAIPNDPASSGRRPPERARSVRGSCDAVRHSRSRRHAGGSTAGPHHGRRRLLRRDDRAGWKRPILALEIAVEEVFFHCPKARSCARTPGSPSAGTPAPFRASPR